MVRTVNLYEARTHLARLVDETAAGEEIIIAKNRVPKARLLPIVAEAGKRKPSGLLTFTCVVDDLDEPLPDCDAIPVP